MATNPYLVELEKQKKLLAERQANAMKALKSNYDESVSTINKNNDIASKQAFVNYKQNEKALPEDLARVGVTGGASESALIKLKNAYVSALERIANTRNADLGSAKNKYDVNLANTGNEYSRQMANVEQVWNDKAIRWQAEQDEIARKEAEAAARAYYGRGGGGYGSSNDIDTMDVSESMPKPASSSSSSSSKKHKKAKSASGSWLSNAFKSIFKNNNIGGGSHHYGRRGVVPVKRYIKKTGKRKR